MHLNNQLLNSVLDGLNLALELARLASGDASGDDRARDVAGTGEGSLGGDEDVGDVLREHKYNFMVSKTIRMGVAS